MASTHLGRFSIDDGHDMEVWQLSGRAATSCDDDDESGGPCRRDRGGCGEFLIATIRGTEIWIVILNVV